MISRYESLTVVVSRMLAPCLKSLGLEFEIFDEQVYEVSEFLHHLHATTTNNSSSHKLTFRRRITSLIGGNYCDGIWQRGLNGWEEQKRPRGALGSSHNLNGVAQLSTNGNACKALCGRCPGACRYLEL